MFMLRSNVGVNKLSYFVCFFPPSPLIHRSAKFAVSCTCKIQDGTGKLIWCLSETFPLFFFLPPSAFLCYVFFCSAKQERMSTKEAFKNTMQFFKRRRRKTRKPKHVEMQIHINFFFVSHDIKSQARKIRKWFWKAHRWSFGKLSR